MPSVTARYSEVLRTPGALAFSASGLVARLPMSMFGLSIVLAITELGGSYGRAGVFAGIGLVAHAAGSPIQARLADRLSQRRMLLPIIAAHVAGLTGLIWLLPDAAAGDAPLALFVAVVSVAGATLPQMGALVRARWAHLERAAPGAAAGLHTAYAWESILDEVIFVTGPILAVLLATSVHGLAGLVAIGVFTVSGGLAFAALRSTDPPGRRLASASDREPLPIATLIWLVIAFSFMGAIFGSVEVATVAFTEALGAKSASGPVLAVFAGGSLIAGVVTGAVSWHATPRRRFVIGQAALAVAVVPLMFIGSIPLLIPAIFIAGFGISPTLIAGFSMVEAEVPASRLTEGLAWVSTALGIGVALGAAVAGPVIDRIGPSEAFGVAFACGALATAACLLGMTLDRPREPTSPIS